jgi:predicted TIM-barrel fold metal-dependent hydrolase
MRVVTIEEHWTTAEIDRAVRAQAVDPSVAFNDRGDIPERLFDIGAERIAAMDAAGVDLQIISLSPPGTYGLPADEAARLCRAANDRAAEAVAEHPDRFRAMTTLPMSDPAAALAELERTGSSSAFAGIMTYGRCGDRPLDHPAYDEVLAAAAAHARPLFIHPQIPPAAVREASYSGLGETIDLSLSTFGWGWHMEAGTAALRLILSGAFDRHPDLQIVLGHWGEMLLFWLDRADSLSNVAALNHRVADYFRTNVHVATSGMLTPRLLRHALDFTTADRILLSGDYPFHRLGPTSIQDFLDILPDPEDRRKIAHANADALYGLTAPELQQR